MKTIESLEVARKKETSFDELGVNRTFFWAYVYSREAETETVDFSEVIWERDIPMIIQACHRFEIKAITISCGMSSMAQTIWEFEKHGCKLAGMTEVNGRFEDWKTGARERKPAFLIEIAPA